MNDELQSVIAKTFNNLLAITQRLNERITVLEQAKRSEVPQGCPPSAMGSASAAPTETEAVNSKPVPMASLPSNGKAEDEASDDSSVVQLPVSDPSGTELLPCPHCGSDAVLYESSKGFFIMCQNTNSPACDIGNCHNDWTREKVIKMWNRRTGTKSSRPEGTPSAAGVSGGS